MRNIAIHGINISEESIPLVDALVNRLLKEKSEVAVSKRLKSQSLDCLSSFPTFEKGDNLKGFEMILSLGGDGTLLDTLTYVGSAEVPIMGINLGRLGFLASISQDDLDSALTNYFNGEFELDKRTLLELNSDVPGFQKTNFALNECAILRKDSSSMIVVRCYLNNEYLNTYWADGLMVSTPTGSTGYSLSCGGPVIMPQTKNFIITPVSPHNLNVRPLIVSEDSELIFEIETRDQSFLVSMDSRSEAMKSGAMITVRKAPFSANLVKVKGISFLDTLRGKLTWGLDRRN
ncbi:NAD kinase [Marinoscillum sp. MHG1-6]|uniref:NAD kinase n=1 Tax=Marinoscillum sp. MHG1-6 TaxID=2959627 RepID=UPI00215709A6|nr:NAD kinase [Marinoscillum sp. MHG1-6]